MCNKLGVKFVLLLLTNEISIPKTTEQLIDRLVKLEIVVKIRHAPIFPHIPPHFPEVPFPAPEISRMLPQPPGGQPPPHGNEIWNIGLIDARCKAIKYMGEGVGHIGFIDVSYK